MENKLTTVQKIGGLISTLVLGQTKEIIIRTDERVQNIMKATDELKQALDDFRLSLNSHGLDIKALQVHTKYGISNSPTVPGPQGNQLLTEAGFYTQYPKFKEKLFALMDTMNLRTLYDSEVGAFDALKKLQNDPAMDPLKDYAVNHPDESLDLIFKVASWLIRDEYAKERKIV